MPHPRTRLRALVVAAAAIALTLTASPAAHASPSASDLTKKIDTESKQLELVGEQYNALNIQLAKTNSDLKKLQASLAPAQAALTSATSQVGTIATQQYEQGRIGPMSALLTGDSNDLMAKMSYLDQIQQSNQNDINTYTTATQTFAQRQAELNTTKAKQAAQLQTLAKSKQTIAASIKTLRAQRTQAYGSATETAHSYNGTVPDLPGSAGKAVAYAYNHIGSSYDIGAAGPHVFDCSGLTMMAWAAAGYDLPHNARAQWGVVAHISRDELKPGDLVFYENLGHVAIYVGNNQVIDAPTYGKLVDVRSINRGMPLYGYGRVN